MAKQRKFSTESKKFFKNIHNIGGIFQHIPGNACQFRNPLLQFPVWIQHGVKPAGFLPVFHAHRSNLNDFVLLRI